MMFATRIAVLGMLLLSVHAAQAEETSVLKDVSASVMAGHSRIAFQFAGDVRFSTEQGKNAVRIVFSRTRAASAQVLARQVLTAGPVESIAFQRPASDSIIAVISLTAGSTYRCVCPASGTELYVDVKGSAAVRQRLVPAKPVKAQTAPAAAPAVAVQEPARTSGSSSLIDIPGVARRQMEQENARQDKRAGRMSEDMAGLPAGSVVLISVLIGLGVTVVLLGLVARSQRTPLPVPVAAVTVPDPAVTPVQMTRIHPLYVDDDDMKPEPERVRALFSAPMREEEPEEDYGRETSLQLARTFRRGSEEISLARKFHEHPTSTLTPAKMQTAMSRATTKTQRLSAARKLGVGRGEFDLADKLKAMSQSPVKKEEQA